MPFPPAPPPRDRQTRGSFDLGHWLTTHGISVRTEKPWQGGTLFTLDACPPFSSAHTDGAFAIQFANGALFAGCHHDSCGGGSQRWQELRAMYEPERIAGKEKAGTKPQKQESSHGSEEPPENPPHPHLFCRTLQRRNRNNANRHWRFLQTATRSISSSTSSTATMSGTARLRNVSQCPLPHNPSKTPPGCTSPYPATPGRARLMPAMRCSASCPRRTG
ncbi:hypothetical protein [Methanogenium cariaci]|uniref:hypothetical protein n=1 Tax=Methanogenium cariaci TaxID=2197 RepID=UPI00158333DB|nr:hypothetical protein [Methanogenium cariaci]